MDTIDSLMEFSLTRQEANIYLVLVINGNMTGYEVAKHTGISRSNIYTALAALVDKGAAYIIEENATHYSPIPINEFCNNKIRELEKFKDLLIKNMPKRREKHGGYITIRGEKNILNKMINMIKETEERIYISVSDKTLKYLLPYLQETIKKQLKVVIITNPPFQLSGAVVYHAAKAQNQIRLIVDSLKVLTGDLSEGEYASCLYSTKQNLIDIFKESLKNEIELIKLKH